ncbi:unnamed protein product [Lupinus luteus]|uniref:Secreted protein n=1 Tax=Lupinus luteus TaxID=3873 RepID=A0AAV1XXV3_LUPLU
MAMTLDLAFWIAKMVWLALTDLISSCLNVADEVASSLRSGDIGPFHWLVHGQNSISGVAKSNGRGRRGPFFADFFGNQRLL